MILIGHFTCLYVLPLLLHCCHDLQLTRKNLLFSCQFKQLSDHASNSEVDSSIYRIRLV